MSDGESLDVKEATWKAHIIAKIDSLHSCFYDMSKKFQENNTLMWSKLDTQRDKIQTQDIRFARIDIQLAIMTKIMWVIVICSLTSVIAVFWKTILK